MFLRAASPLRTQKERASFSEALVKGGFEVLEDSTCFLLASGRRSVRHTRRTGDEEIVIVKIAVHVAGNLSGFRSEGGTAALQKDHHHNASTAGVGIGSKPAEPRSRMGTSTGLAENLFLT